MQSLPSSPQPKKGLRKKYILGLCAQEFPSIHWDSPMVHEYLIIQLGERPECRLRALSLLNVLCSERRLPEAFLPVAQRFPTYKTVREAQR